MVNLMVVYLYIYLISHDRSDHMHVCVDLADSVYLPATVATGTSRFEVT